MALARQIALLSMLATALIAIAGCGGDESSSADLDPAIGEAINAKLDQIQERADAGECTGENSAESSLDSLRDDVPSLLADEDEQFVSDLSEMLDELGTQIAEQCEQEEETTTKSTTSSTTDETETEPIEPTTTETTTEDTDETTTTTTEETTQEPPDDEGEDDGPTTPTVPSGGGGGTPGGGNLPDDPGGSGGFTPDRKTGEPGESKQPKDDE